MLPDTFRAPEASITEEPSREENSSLEQIIAADIVEINRETSIMALKWLFECDPAAYRAVKKHFIPQLNGNNDKLQQANINDHSYQKHTRWVASHAVAAGLALRGSTEDNGEYPSNKLLAPIGLGGLVHDNGYQFGKDPRKTTKADLNRHPEIGAENMAQFFRNPEVRNTFDMFDASMKKAACDAIRYHSTDSQNFDSDSAEVAVLLVMIVDKLHISADRLHEGMIRSNTDIRNREGEIYPHRLVPYCIDNVEFVIDKKAPKFTAKYTVNLHVAKDLLGGQPYTSSDFENDFAGGYGKHISMADRGIRLLFERTLGTSLSDVPDVFERKFEYVEGSYSDQEIDII